MNDKQYDLPILKCLRCGHTWTPRTSVRTKVCPKCKSPYWDKPKWKGIKDIKEIDFMIGKRNYKIVIPSESKISIVGKPRLRGRAELCIHMYEIAKRHRDLAKLVEGKNIKAEIKESMISIIFAYTCLEAFINALGVDTLADGYNYNWEPLTKWNKVGHALTKEPLKASMPIFSLEEKPFSSFEELENTRNKLIHYKARMRDVAKTKYGPEIGLITWVNYSKAEQSCSTILAMIKKLHNSVGITLPNWLKQE